MNPKFHQLVTSMAPQNPPLCVPLCGGPCSSDWLRACLSPCSFGFNVLLEVESLGLLGRNFTTRTILQGP